MATSALDILDTAVKIGLGACITALATHLQGKWSSKRDAVIERSRKRRETYEQIAEQIEEFTHVALSYWALITEWSRFRLAHETMPEERLIKLRDTRENLHRAFKHLTVAESRLLLLGEDAAQRSLREYGELITRFTQVAFIGGAPLSREEQDKWRIDILGARTQLFTQLSTLYSSLSV